MHAMQFVHLSVILYVSVFMPLLLFSLAATNVHGALENQDRGSRMVQSLFQCCFGFVHFERVNHLDKLDSAAFCDFFNEYFF